VTRANTWRARLDATTNWAVATTAAALTFTFGAPQNTHFVLLLALLLVLTFLYIEARRYRHYELWYYRVHLMETDFFAAMLIPPFRPSSDWAAQLAESLLHPTFPIARWEAIGWRFRRNYIWMISLLIISWLAKLAIHPTSAPDWFTMIGRASVGNVPGSWIVVAVGVVYGVMIILAVAASIPASWRQTPGRLSKGVADRFRQTAGPLVPGISTPERLATIITSHGEKVAEQILSELGRGVTAVQGTGMYTGEARDVLLCAVTKVQMPHLEDIVYRCDADAFVVISATEEVRGFGFQDFRAPS
jgi:uncharacterized membrane protein